MTEKLYYENPYLCDFTAEIIEKVKCDKGWRIQLNRTAFYPEGGGQPADKGTLDGIVVFDVQKEENRVYHYVYDLPESDSVNGEIDWNHRFDYMQQHTGQHILSAVLKRVTDSATVAVHQAGDYTSIEIDHSDFSHEQIELIEDWANALICDNLPVYTYLNGSTPVSAFPIRRETKFTEDVRLVQIGGTSLEKSSVFELKEAGKILSGELELVSPAVKDLAACGGVHTGRTGEVGLIKFRSQEKVRGRLRLFWIIGKRAFRDYRLKTEITDKIGEALSVSLNGIPVEFDRFKAGLGEEKKRNSDLLKEMAFLKADEIRNAHREGKRTFVFDRADPTYFKQITIGLSEFPDLRLCLLNVKENEGQWAVLSTGEHPFDFNSFRADLLPLVEGKGGGKAPLWQGKLGNCSSLADFEEKFLLMVT